LPLFAKLFRSDANEIKVTQPRFPIIQMAAGVIGGPVVFDRAILNESVYELGEV
jgi:hypothetical protein